MGRDVYLVCDECKTRTDAFRWSASPGRIYIENICAMFSKHDHDCDGGMRLIEDCNFSNEQSFDYKSPEHKYWPSKEKKEEYKICHASQE